LGGEKPGTAAAHPVKVPATIKTRRRLGVSMSRIR
jgi:hypothetical protein